MKTQITKKNTDTPEILPIISHIFIILAVYFIVSVPESLSEQTSGYRSPQALAAGKNGKTVYVAETSARCVSVFDTVSGKITGTIKLKEQPNGLALSPDGNTLYVTCSTPNGTVEVIDIKSMKVRKTIYARHTPCSPLVSPDGSMLYICNRFNNSVSVIDCATGETMDLIPMLREPIASTMTRDGKYLFFANHLPTGERIYDYVTDGGIMMIGSYISTGYHTGSRESYASSGVVLVYDTSFHRLVELIPLLPGSTGLKGMCLSADGRFVYVTHVFARYQLPTSQPERGWINTNAVSIIDTERWELLNTILLDDVDNGAANPWGIACSPDNTLLCVAHSGTNEISLIDRTGLHERLDRLAAGDTVICASGFRKDVPGDLTFLTGLRQRIRLKGTGPRGLVIAGETLFAAEYFSDTLGMIDIDSAGKREVRSVPLGEVKLPSPKRLGEMYFHDATLCYQQWQSCASCHPDGREDGLFWDLLNDGIGNPKNTKSLLLSHRTPPVMATGIRKDAEAAVRAGIKHSYFSALPDSVACAIDAYLASLKPVPSPYLIKGRMSKEAKTGGKVFKRAGCAECHPKHLFTDLRSYNVGTGTGRDKHHTFDTPTLVELWRTAPYLYDGRTDSLYEILTEYNKSDMHGKTSSLSNIELYDLIEYLLSL